MRSRTANAELENRKGRATSHTSKVAANPGLGPVEGYPGARSADDMGADQTGLRTG